MHPSSMIFALLLNPVAIAAQTVSSPDAAPDKLQFQAQAFAAQAQAQRIAQACPVWLSVDRIATGAVVWTNGESDWLKAHPSLSLLKLQDALKAEPGFGKLTPEAQQQKLDQIAQIYHAQRGQGLNVNILKPKARIAAADITVRGYPAGAHAIPATPSMPAEVTETFHLTESSGLPILRSSVWTERMAVISSVELTRIVYADGTTWQPSTPRQCQTSPSLYVPVTLSAQ